MLASQQRPEVDQVPPRGCRLAPGRRGEEPCLQPPWALKNWGSKDEGGTSLVVQWLRLCSPNAGGLGSVPGPGTRSHMHAATKSSHATTKEPA